MVTNREKHIDNASNEELANTLGKLIAEQINANENIRSLSGKEESKTKREIYIKTQILKWLSQEAEESKMCGSCKYISGGLDIEWVKNCDNNYSSRIYTKDDAVACDKWEPKEKWGIGENHTQIANLPNETKKIELTEKAYKNILVRLDRLENKVLNSVGIVTIYNDNYDTGLRTIGKDKTANEMFEELGYKIDDEQEDGSIQFTKKGNIESDDFEISIIDIQKKNGEWVFYKMQDYDLEGITEAEDKAIHKKIEELLNGKS